MTYVHLSQFDNSPAPDDRSPEFYRVAIVDSLDGSDVVAAWFQLWSEFEPPEWTSESVTIGDFTGELVTYPDGENGEPVWFELRFQLPDGTEASISSERVTVEELVALAETARPATGEEVQTMRNEFEERMAQEAPPTTTKTPPPTPRTTGDLPGTSGLSTTTEPFPTTPVTTGRPSQTPSTVPSPVETTGPTEPMVTTEG